VSSRGRQAPEKFMPLSHWQILAVFAGVLGGAGVALEVLVPDLAAAVSAGARDSASAIRRASVWTGALAFAGGVVVVVVCDAINRFTAASGARQGIAQRETRFLTSLGSRHDAGDADPLSFDNQPK
jgi:hypothetical protein